MAVFPCVSVFDEMSSLFRNVDNLLGRSHRGSGEEGDQGGVSTGAFNTEEGFGASFPALLIPECGGGGAWRGEASAG